MSEHPCGASDKEFDQLFGIDTPVIFAYHGFVFVFVFGGGVFFKFLITLTRDLNKN